MKLGYKPTHIERRNAIKQFLDKSWVNTYNKPPKLSKYRYEQIALIQDNVISVASSPRLPVPLPSPSSPIIQEKDGHGFWVLSTNKPSRQERV